MKFNPISIDYGKFFFFGSRTGTESNSVDSMSGLIYKKAAVILKLKNI